MKIICYTNRRKITAGGNVLITIRVAPVLSKIFFAFILLISLLPFERYYFSLLGIKVAYGYPLMLMLYAILIPMHFKKLPSTLSADRSIKLLYFILLFAFISTYWANHIVEYGYIFYQIILTFLTISIPYLLSKITNDKHIDYHKLISNFATLLTLISLIYLVQSIGDGDASRMKGPLAGAALISVILIPTLAVHLHNVLHRKRMLISTLCVLLTTAAVFFTQSRAGLIMLILFIAVTILRKPTILRVLVIATLVAIFLISFSDDVSTERYESFEDESRSTMLETSLNWWKDSPTSIFFGNGYGSIWQWSAYQVGEVGGWIGPWKFTEHGRIMYHAHSVFNQLVAELGLFGLIPFLILLLILFKEAWKSWRRKEELRTNILIALICTLPTFHTDLMIFRNWGVSIVWLFFFFAALRYIPKPKNVTVKENRSKVA